MSADIVDLEAHRARRITERCPQLSEPYAEVRGEYVLIHCSAPVRLTASETLEWARSLIKAAHAARSNGGGA